MNLVFAVLITLVGWADPNLGQLSDSGAFNLSGGSTPDELANTFSSQSCDNISKKCNSASPGLRLSANTNPTSTAANKSKANQ